MPTAEFNRIKRLLNAHNMQPGSVWTGTQTYVIQFSTDDNFRIKNRRMGQGYVLSFLVTGKQRAMFASKSEWINKIVDYDLEFSHIDLNRVKFFNSVDGQIPEQLPAIHSIWHATDERILQINRWVKPIDYPYSDYTAECTLLNPKDGQHTRTKIEHFSFGRRLLAHDPQQNQQRVQEIQEVEEDSSFIMHL